MTDKELLEWALAALDGYARNCGGGTCDAAEALRARLAQPEEPDWSAAGFSKSPKQQDRQCPSCGGFCTKSGCERENVPAKREWQGLTDEQVKQIEMSASSILSAIYLTEAQLKGKNAL